MADRVGTSRWARTRLLLLSADPLAAEGIISQLETWGAQPTVIFDLPTAIDALEYRRPQIVVLDSSLTATPGPHSVELLRQLRAWQLRDPRPVPVALLGPLPEARSLLRSAGGSYGGDWLRLVPAGDPQQVRRALETVLAESGQWPDDAGPRFRGHGLRAAAPAADSAAGSPFPPPATQRAPTPPPAPTPQDEGATERIGYQHAIVQEVKARSTRNAPPAAGEGAVPAFGAAQPVLHADATEPDDEAPSTAPPWRAVLVVGAAILVLAMVFGRNGDRTAPISTGPASAPAPTAGVVEMAGTSELAGTTARRDTNAPITGATVIARGPSGTLTAASDSQGRWRFGQLKAGTYIVAATAPGLEPQQIQIEVPEGRALDSVHLMFDPASR